MSACPGVGRPPITGGYVAGRVSPVGICPCCLRQYTLKVGPTGGPWVIRHHKGLPKPADGGCPYRCPDDCDFNCYIPEGHREH